MPENHTAGVPLRPIVVMMLGPPGCGKGTQARELSRHFGLIHLSTGDILRAAAAQDTEMGRNIRAIMESGKLIPDALICQIVADRIIGTGSENGLILDGFPRTLEQARFILGLARDWRMVALNFQLAHDVLVQRVLGRMTCSACGEIYNRLFRPPRRAGVCDFDSVTLDQRSDDKEEVLRSRLELYEKETLRMVEHFRSMGTVEDVDASLDAATQTAQLRALLGGVLERAAPPVKQR